MAKKSNIHRSIQDGNSRDFWSFLQNISCGVSGKGVGLLSRSLSLTAAGAEKMYYYDNYPFTLVLDGETSLHILYGRAFSDWICGGQWSQMMKFLDALIATLRDYNVFIAVCLNGCHEPQRFNDWVRIQKQMKGNANKIFRHLHRRAIPPPKAWWIPPAGLRSTLRLGLATLNNPAFCSLDDHYLDMMNFIWKNNFQGVLGNHPDLIFFKPPRLFSARTMKLSAELDLITTEYNLEGVAKSLDLNPARFCLLGALLGNHILSYHDLSEFHSRLAPELKTHKQNKGVVQDRVIRGVVNYIRKLPSIDDYDQIGQDVFCSSKDSPDPRLQKLKESVEYYSQGTREILRRRKRMEPRYQKGKFHSVPFDGIQYSIEKPNVLNDVALSNGDKMPLLNEITNGLNGHTPSKGDISVVPPLVTYVSSESTEEETIPAKENSNSIKILPIPEEVRRTAADRHRHAAMSPYIYQVLSHGEIKFPVVLENMKSNNLELPRIHEFYRPLRQSVYAILFNLHHHRFTQKQQEENKRSLESSISDLVKKSSDSELSEDDKSEVLDKLETLRQELSDLIEPKDIEVRIREWVPYNSYQSPVIVQGIEVPWGIPTIQRLWFGTSIEDKEKRIRAFMSCMRCDDVKPFLLQTSIIPAHLLFMSCILRYIMVSSTYPVLKKPELDAFLLSSLKIGSVSEPPSPPLPQLDIVTPRGVQLASLFMEGVEMALLANDVCGAPLPVHLTLPWTFFNGALFHTYLRKAGTVRNLFELCGRNEELMSQIELMKSAIIPELMSNNELRLPKRNSKENGSFVMNGGAFCLRAWQPIHDPFSNGRVLARKKGTKGKSVSVVKNKKSESKKVKARSSISPRKKKVNEESTSLTQ